eukprot:3136319-Amphidinium_carterae.1
MPSVQQRGAHPPLYCIVSSYQSSRSHHQQPHMECCLKTVEVTECCPRAEAARQHGAPSELVASESTPMDISSAGSHTEAVQRRCHGNVPLAQNCGHGNEIRTQSRCVIGMKIIILWHGSVCNIENGSHAAECRSSWLDWRHEGCPEKKRPSTVMLLSVERLKCHRRINATKPLPGYDKTDVFKMFLINNSILKYE